MRQTLGTRNGSGETVTCKDVWEYPFAKFRPLKKLPREIWPGQFFQVGDYSPKKKFRTEPLNGGLKGSLEGIHLTTL